MTDKNPSEPSKINSLALLLPDHVLFTICSFLFSVFQEERNEINDSVKRYDRSVNKMELVPFASNSPLSKFVDNDDGYSEDCVDSKNDALTRSYCDLVTNWINLSHVNRRLRDFLRKNIVVSQLLEFDMINFCFFHYMGRPDMDAEASDDYKQALNSLFMEFIEAFVECENVKRISLDTNLVMSWVSSEGNTASSLSVNLTNYLDEYRNRYPNLELLTLNFSFEGKPADNYQDLALCDIDEEPSDVPVVLKFIDPSSLSTVKEWNNLKELRVCWHVQVSRDISRPDLSKAFQLVEESLNLIKTARSNPSLEYISFYTDGSPYHICSDEEGNTKFNELLHSQILEKIDTIFEDQTCQSKLIYLCIENCGLISHSQTIFDLTIFQNILHIEIDELTSLAINQLFCQEFPQLVTLIISNIKTEGYGDILMSCVFPQLEELSLSSYIDSSDRYSCMNTDLVLMKAPKLRSLSLFGVGSLEISKDSIGKVLEKINIVSVTLAFDHKWISKIASLKSIKIRIVPDRCRSYHVVEGLDNSIFEIHNDNIKKLFIKHTKCQHVVVKCASLKKLVIHFPDLHICDVNCPEVDSVDINGVLLQCNIMLGISFSNTNQWKWTTPLITSLNLTQPSTTGVVLPNSLISHIERLEIKLAITTYENEKELLPPLFTRVDDRNAAVLKYVKIHMDVGTYYIPGALTKNMIAVLVWDEKNKYSSEGMKKVIQTLLNIAKNTDHKTETLIFDDPSIVSLDINVNDCIKRTKIVSPFLKSLDFVQHSPGRIKIYDECSQQIERLSMVGICSPFNHLSTIYCSNLRFIEIIDPKQRFSFHLECLPNLEVLDIRKVFGCSFCGEDRSYITMKDIIHEHLKMLRVKGVMNVSFDLDLSTPNLRIVEIVSVTSKKDNILFTYCPKLLKKVIDIAPVEKMKWENSAGYL